MWEAKMYHQAMLSRAHRLQSCRGSELRTVGTMHRANEDESELMTTANLHQPLSYRPSAEIEDLDTRLLESDRGIEDWYRYWDHYYGVSRGVWVGGLGGIEADCQDSIGMMQGHFLRESCELSGSVW